MGSDGHGGGVADHHLISIHAPAWGATRLILQWFVDEMISIHAPAWGATHLAGNNSDSVLDFNPRSRMGSDITRRKSLFTQLVFQSTLPHGERRKSQACRMQRQIFQSTLPHGERLMELVNEYHSYPISIHAPAWGATSIFYFRRFDIVFQSTLPHGERHGCQPAGKPSHRFQSTLPHGERHRLRVWLSVAREFQSTLPHGERHRTVNGLAVFFTISIHAPAWGATKGGTL